MDGAGDAYFFDLLPGTRMEGERVGTRLRVSPWLDATALEGRLKAECRSPRILHLATHGFFLPDQERGFNRAARGLALDSGDFPGAQGGRDRIPGAVAGEPDAPLEPGAGRGQRLANRCETGGRGCRLEAVAKVELQVLVGPRLAIVSWPRGKHRAARRRSEPNGALHCASASR
jgi:hypothetical protein